MLSLKIFLTSKVNIQLNTETKFEKSVNGKLNIGSTRISKIVSLLVKRHIVWCMNLPTKTPILTGRVRFDKT